MRLKVKDKVRILNKTLGYMLGENRSFKLNKYTIYKIVRIDSYANECYYYFKGVPECHCFKDNELKRIGIEIL